MEFYITLAVAVAILIVSLHPKFRPVGKRHNIPVNFLLTLVATFLGVFLSTQVSERQGREQSRQESIQLLNSLSQDARSKIAAARHSHIFASDSKLKPVASLNQFSPSSLRQIIMTGSSLRNFSPEFVTNVNMYASFLESYMEGYRTNEFMSTGEFRTVYDDTMKRLVVLMELEKHVVRGEVEPETHRLLYRCFFNLGSAASAEDPTCARDASKAMVGMPVRFLRLKELEELEQSRGRNLPPEE